MGYRDTYFKYVSGYNGLYQCCNCGNWFEKSQIDIDHRIPKKHGGTDDISNLQAMCRHCNRSKNATVTAGDYLQTGVNTFRNNGLAGLGNMVANALAQEAKNSLGVKYDRHSAGLNLGGTAKKPRKSRKKY